MDANTPLKMLGNKQRTNCNYTIKIKKMKEEIRIFDHEMKHFRKNFSVLKIVWYIVRERLRDAGSEMRWIMMC
jgi:hypothetical protein